MSVRGGSVRSEGNSVIRFEPVPRQVRVERDPDAAALLALVAKDQQVPLPLLLHRSRCRARVAATRQLAMYLMNVVLGRSLTEVGEFFGRDRTTVSHACGLIEDRRDDAGFDAELDRLEAEIRVLVGEDDFASRREAIHAVR
jgi:chromosomal replication initiation ATPase DnaA